MELDRLGAYLEAAVSGTGGVVGISAEAGMGKSRLVAEFVRERPSPWAGSSRSASARHMGRNTSYFGWREVWRTLFHLRDDEPEEAQLARLEAELSAIDPGLVPRMPLLEPVVGLPIPDNDLTRAFDAKLRKTSLEGLLAVCLSARAAHQPLVIVLEDCHWLDELSRDLLVTLARSVSHLRVLIVLAYRPPSDVGEALGVETMPHFSEIALAELGPHEAGLLIALEARAAARRGQRAARGTRRARHAAGREGNPFYVEELLNYISGQGIDLPDEAALKGLELPESLNSLILSRIDKLSEKPRRTLKVASVIGRLFRAPMLPGVYPELGDYAEIREHLGPTERARPRRCRTSRRTARGSSSTWSRRRSPTRACRSRSAGAAREHGAL